MALSPQRIEAGIRSVRRGHSPNCSSAGSVVGMALVSTAAAGVVVNLLAGRLARWMRGGGGEPPTVRREPTGAAVHLEAPGAVLLVDDAVADALDAAGARVVGNGVAPRGAMSAPTEVHLAVTDRCPAACDTCYLSAGPDGAHPELSELREQLDALAAMGVFEVAFGGGEGLLRDDLFDLATHARELGMVPNLTTSGFGLTPRAAARCGELFGQVNVSLDGLEAVYAEVRGWSGADRAFDAIGLLASSGARVGVNTVLSRMLLDGRHLEELGDRLDQRGALEWQWLRLKPTGRGAAVWQRLSPTVEQLDGLWPRALALSGRLELTLRFDCALVPFVVNHRPPLALVERMGLSGCPAGHSLWARSASGAWAPCSFAAGTPLADWDEDETLRAWRARAAAPPEPCASCEYRAVCRGGCRVVAEHLAGDAMAADPQCQRVRMHAA